MMTDTLNNVTNSGDNLMVRLYTLLLQLDDSYTSKGKGSHNRNNCNTVLVLQICMIYLDDRTSTFSIVPNRL